MSKQLCQYSRQELIEEVRKLRLSKQIQNSGVNYSGSELDALNNALIDIFYDMQTQILSEAHIQDLEHSINVLSSKNSMLTKRLSDKNSLISELNTELNLHKTTIRRLRERLEEQTKQLKHTETRAQTLSDDLSRTSIDLERANLRIAELERTANKNNALLEKNAQQLRTRNNELQVQNVAFEQNNHQLRKALIQAHHQIQQQQQHIHDLEHQQDIHTDQELQRMHQALTSLQKLQSQILLLLATINAPKSTCTDIDTAKNMVAEHIQEMTQKHM